MLAAAKSLERSWREASCGAKSAVKLEKKKRQSALLSKGPVSRTSSYHEAEKLVLDLCFVTYYHQFAFPKCQHPFYDAVILRYEDE